MPQPEVYIGGAAAPFDKEAKSHEQGHTKVSEALMNAFAAWIEVLLARRTPRPHK
jgi:hypothetical protein